MPLLCKINILSTVFFDIFFMLVNSILLVEKNTLVCKSGFFLGCNVRKFNSHSLIFLRTMHENRYGPQCLLVLPAMYHWSVEYHRYCTRSESKRHTVSCWDDNRRSKTKLSQWPTQTNSRQRPSASLTFHFYAYMIEINHKLDQWSRVSWNFVNVNISLLLVYCSVQSDVLNL